MDDFKRKRVMKEQANYLTPPRRKDPKGNKRQRSRLKRELPKPPILDRRDALEEAVWAVEKMLSDKPALAKDITDAIRALKPKDEPQERMIPESHARWIADELNSLVASASGRWNRLSDSDWAQLLTEAADACSTK